MKPHATRSRVIIIAVAIAALGALALWQRDLIFPGGTVAVTSQSGAAPTLPVAVSGPMVTTLADGVTQVPVAAATPGTISVTIEGPSVVEPFRQQEVRTRTAGLIVEAAQPGDTVEAGGILIRLDERDQLTALRQAELNLAQARLDLERTQLAAERAAALANDRRSLFASGTISRDQLDDALETASTADLALAGAGIRVDQSTLAVETATAALEATTITAPFTGVVLSATVGPGSAVAANSVLMSFADLTRLRLNAEVDEFDIGSIAVGMPVTITADAMGRESVSSVVERISPAAEIINNISIFTVSTVIRGSASVLRPGMSADVAILVSDDTGLVVPANAVSTVRGRSYLDVVENGEVVTKRVTAGASNGATTVITEGLVEGDLIVVPQLPTFALGAAAPAPATEGSSLLPISVPGTGGSR